MGNVILFLAAGESSYRTGAEYLVDAGGGRRVCRHETHVHNLHRLGVGTVLVLG